MLRVLLEFENSTHRCRLQHQIVYESNISQENGNQRHELLLPIPGIQQIQFFGIGDFYVVNSEIPVVIEKILRCL